MENKLSYALPVWDTITAAWEKVSGAKATILGAILICFCVFFPLEGLVAAIKHHSPIVGGAFSLIVSYIEVILLACLTYIGIMRANGQPISIRLFSKSFEPHILKNLLVLYISKFVIFLAPLLIAGAVTFLLSAIMNLFTHTGTDVALVANVSADQLPSAQGNISASLKLISTLLYVIVMFTGFFIMYHLFFRLSLSTGYVMVKGLSAFDAIKTSFNATRNNTWHIFLIYLCLTLITFISAIPFGIGLIWSMPLYWITDGEIYKRLSVNFK